MLKQKKCAVTGATGYLGAHLVLELEHHGWEVVEIGRKPLSKTSRNFIQWDLDMPLEPQAIDGIDALIHCAWDFFTISFDESLMKNVNGSICLLKQAFGKNLKVIFISTISAFEGTKTIYGRSKFEVENFVLQQGGIVVRPGLIWGSNIGGMIGSLSKVIKRFPLIPLPGASQYFYTSHINDLTSLIVLLCDYKPLPLEDMLITAVSPIKISFLDIMKILEKKMGKSRFYLPISWKPLYLILKILECLNLKSRFSSDSLLSLMSMKKTVNLSWIEIHRIYFRPFIVHTED